MGSLLTAFQSGPGSDAALVLVGIVLGLYLIDCAIWPRAKHRLCGGTGRLKSPMSGAERDCRCGNGKIRRLGARLIGRG